MDDAKLRKVRVQGIACLELDASRFRVGGRVRVRDLNVEVVTDTRNKRWLHHPQLDAEVRNVEAALRQEVERERLASVERDRWAAWLRAEPADRLREHYLTALESPLGRITIDGHEWRESELARALAENGWPSATEEALSGEASVARCLALIKAIASGAKTSIEPVLGTFLDRHLTQQPHQQFATLVSIAFKVYSPRLTDDQRRRLGHANDYIIASLKAYERSLARPTKHDKFVAFLFPEMADALAKPFGTREKVEEELRNVRQRELERQEQQRAKNLERESQHRSAFEAAAVENAITDACRSGWQPPLGFTRDAEQILSMKDVKYAMRTHAPYGIDGPPLIRSACDARANGVTLDTWFRAQGLRDRAAVAALHNLLKAAWLVVDSAPSGRR